MNFRTTISLLVLLVAAAVVYYVTVVRRGDTDQVLKPDAAAERKVLPAVNTADVKRIVITPATGDRLAFERSGTDWRMVEPVRAPADTFKVDDLVREVTGLTSRGQVDPGDKGVDQPQYTVELTHGADSKTTTVKVGNRSPVGDMLYVRVGDDKQADVVSASVVDQLEKPAADYRKARLLDVTNDKITALSIAQGDKTLRLQKSPADDKWRIVEPKDMPGDETQVSSLLSAVTGLDAVKFVAEDAGGAAGYGLAKPSMTVTFTTEPPATQPSTGPAATGPSTDASAGNTTTIKFGRPDVQKQNVYAMVSDSGPIVTVANTELEGLRKTPLDLRDREVLDLDANAISRMTLLIDRAATTQPTSQPAEKRELVLERRSEVTEAGPPAPEPATAPAEQKKDDAGAPKRDDVPSDGAKPQAAEPEADAPAPPADAPAPTDTPAPSDAPKPEAQPAPQPQVATPDGGAVVTLAAFQDQPADAKPEAPKSADPAPPAPATAEALDPAAEAAPAEEGPKPDAPPATEPSTAPTTEPATQPTTAPAATQPAAPKSKWLIASEPNADANDSHVQSLIDALRPLRAQKYLESFPTTQAAPAATYVLKVSTRPWGDEPAKEHEITITDPGGQAKPVAQVGDLVFEIDRAFLDKLTADFTEPNLPEPPGFPPGDDGSGGLPPDLLRQLQQGQGGR